MRVVKRMIGCVFGFFYGGELAPRSPSPALLFCCRFVFDVDIQYIGFGHWLLVYKKTTRKVTRRQEDQEEEEEEEEEGKILITFENKKEANLLLPQESCLNMETPTGGE
jgi:hypothetical protein